MLRKKKQSRRRKTALLMQTDTLRPLLLLHNSGRRRAAAVPPTHTHPSVQLQQAVIPFGANVCIRRQTVFHEALLSTGWLADWTDWPSSQYQELRTHSHTRMTPSMILFQGGDFQVVTRTATSPTDRLCNDSRSPQMIPFLQVSLSLSLHERGHVTWTLALG